MASSNFVDTTWSEQLIVTCTIHYVGPLYIAFAKSFIKLDLLNAATIYFILKVNVRLYSKCI